MTNGDLTLTAPLAKTLLRRSFLKATLRARNGSLRPRTGWRCDVRNGENVSLRRRWCLPYLVPSRTWWSSI